MLWRQAIVGKFGEESKGWCSRVGREGYGVGLWKPIRKGWGIFKANQDLKWVFSMMYDVVMFP